MTLIAYIRHLARSSYWQNIYRASKDCSNISLFKNQYEYSELQSVFLYWLKLYDMLYIELSKKEWRFLTESVIENNCRCDAFLYYRKRQIDKQILKNKLEENKTQLRSKEKHKSNVTPWAVDMGR